MTTLGPIMALGTRWYIELFEPVLDDAALIEEIKSFLSVFEKKYSRFLPDSLLSQLNQTGELINPDQETLDLFSRALSMYEATKGIFNIAVGAELEAIGYNADYHFTATEAAVPMRPALPEVLTINDDAITVAGARLDLGGIGKGYVIDRLAEHLKSQGHPYFVINGGGDMYVTSDHEVPVEIVLAHPHNPSEHIGSVMLKQQGFAASSPFVRAWNDKKTGTPRNHLLTENKIATYIVATDATTADVYATTLAVNPEFREPSSVYALLLDEVSVVRADDCFILNQSEKTKFCG